MPNDKTKKRTSGLSPSLIDVRRANSTLDENDTILQSLGVLAYRGRETRTGRAIWEELKKSLRLLEEEEHNLDSVDSIRKSVKRGESNEDSDENYKRAHMVAAETWQLSLGFRNERLRQARLAFGATLVCVVLGVAILGFGIFFSMFKSDGFKVATYTSAVGIFVEFVATILLWIYRSAMRRLDVEATIAHELERYRLGIALLEGLDNTTMRDEALRSLIRDVGEHPASMTIDELPTIGLAHRPAGG